MARSKVNLTYIDDDTLRKKTMKKRGKGVLKKAQELSTLCGVDVCVIMYDSESPDSQPAVFPPSHTEVRRVLNKFSNVPRYHQTNKMQDHQLHLEQRIQKMEEQLMKKRRANREQEMMLHIDQFIQTMELPENLTLVDLNDLTYVADQKIKEIDIQLEAIKKKEEEEEMRHMMMTRNFMESSSSFVPPPQDGGAIGNVGLEMNLNVNQNKE